MKTFFRSLLAAALLTQAPAHAQTAVFPNSTLENWATRGGIEAPNNWQTTDDIAERVLGLRIPTGTVTKSTTAHGGSFAVQLQTQLFLGQSEVPGEIILGTSFHGGSHELPGGQPFTARPASLQFYYQLSGGNPARDSAGAFVQLIRRVNGQSVVVAQGEQYYTTPTTGGYTLATIPLDYQSTLAPDTVVMAFASSTSFLTAGTTLLVDDISFVGTATGTRDAANALALQVAPNPSPDGRYRLSSTEPGLLAAPLVVLDAAGRQVRREAALRPGQALAERPLDLSELPVGMYSVQLLAPTGTVTRKLIR
jgi:hypothetical protein